MNPSLIDSAEESVFAKLSPVRGHKVEGISLTSVETKEGGLSIEGH